MQPQAPARKGTPQTQKIEDYLAKRKRTVGPASVTWRQTGKTPPPLPNAPALAQETDPAKPERNVGPVGKWAPSAPQSREMGFTGRTYKGDGYNRMESTDGRWYDPAEIKDKTNPYPTAFKKPMDVKTADWKAGGYQGASGETKRLLAGANALHSKQPKQMPWRPQTGLRPNTSRWTPMGST